MYFHHWCTVLYSRGWCHCLHSPLPYQFIPQLSIVWFVRFSFDLTQWVCVGVDVFLCCLRSASFLYCFRLLGCFLKEKQLCFLLPEKYRKAALHITDYLWWSGGKTSAGKEGRKGEISGVFCILELLGDLNIADPTLKLHQNHTNALNIKTFELVNR